MAATHAKLYGERMLDGSQGDGIEYRVVFENDDGDPVEVGGDGGADITLAGYELGTDDTALADTDTLNEALSKLEVRVAALENA